MFAPRRHRPVALFLGALLLALSAGQVHADAQLAPPLQQWLDNEQGRIDRTVDPSRIMALTNRQDPRFAPEARATFNVKSYWIDADKMHAFEGQGISTQIKSEMVRVVNGKKQVRLLVHPESEGLYRSFLSGVQRAPDFTATATASSRTLMVWPAGKPNAAFFAKLSLDKEIGGVRRTVSQGEVARSVGINNVLHAAAGRGELPSTFKFVPEVFSTIPKSMTEGGLVIRQIPREVVTGQVKYIPLFSLYAKPANGGSPLLAEMIKNSGMSAEAFIREKIIRPFARQWLQLGLRSGIAPQPHAQNLMLEVGANGQPTGKFVHRDFGGFNVDFDFRAAQHLAQPSQLASITTVAKDYKNDRFGGAEHMMKKLDSFFYGGFVYNLDQEVPGWSRQGLLGAQGGTVASGSFKSMLVAELEGQYKQLTGQEVRLGGNLGNIGRLVAGRGKLLPQTQQQQQQRGSTLRSMTGSKTLGTKTQTMRKTPNAKPLFAKTTAKPRSRAGAGLRLRARGRLLMRKLTRPFRAR